MSSIIKQRISIITALLLFVGIPFSAGAFSAVITTVPGVVTAPLKIPFDTALILGGKCVNHNVKVTVTASNAQKTAVQFSQVQLYGKDGKVMGNNVANKTDVLSVTPYSFIFTNLGVPGSQLDKVAGVQIAFIDKGGDDTSGRVTVAAVLVTDDCQSGVACGDPIPDAIVTALPVPPPTLISINRPVVRNPTPGGSSGSAATAGPQGGGTFSDGGGGTDFWLNPNNAATADGIYTSTNISADMVASDLQGRNFGFSIPSTATINGIEFKITLKNDFTNRIVDDSIKLVKAGTTVGTNFARNSSIFWPISDTIVTFGGSTELAGVSWTPADINNTNFGINILAKNMLGGSSSISYIDYVSIKIYYTTGGASVYDSLRDFSRQSMNKFFCTILRQKCDLTR